ncbi:MAG: hypothetical protein WAW86_10585 [Gammaproteobacteria bacterium]
MKYENFGQGKYYYFRSEGAWGVKLQGANEIVAKVCDKNYAGLIADLLNRFGKEYDLLTHLEYEILNKNSN